MSIHRIVVKVHRVAAILFVLCIPGAWYASARGGEPAALVYLPIPFMLVLTITGIYQLVRPWIRKARAQRTGQQADM